MKTECSTQPLNWEIQTLVFPATLFLLLSDCHWPLLFLPPKSYCLHNLIGGLGCGKEEKTVSWSFRYVQTCWASRPPDPKPPPRKLFPNPGKVFPEKPSQNLNSIFSPFYSCLLCIYTFASWWRKCYRLNTCGPRKSYWHLILSVVISVCGHLED